MFVDSPAYMQRTGWVVGLLYNVGCRVVFYIKKIRCFCLTENLINPIKKESVNKGKETPCQTKTDREKIVLLFLG